MRLYGLKLYSVVDKVFTSKKVAFSNCISFTTILPILTKLYSQLYIFQSPQSYILFHGPRKFYHCSNFFRNLTILETYTPQFRSGQG